MNVLKIKQTIGGLDVIQAVYAFAMALGLSEVFRGSKTVLPQVFSLLGPESSATLVSVLVLLVMVNVVLLALRFFWVPRNLRGLIFAAACQRQGEGNLVPLRNGTIALHLLIIFLHGGIFYFLCVEFEYMAFVASSSFPLAPDSLTRYLVLHACLLLLNAAWIWSVESQKRGLRSERDQSQAPGNVWWRNNFIFGLAAVAPIPILPICRDSLMGCISTGTEQPIGPIASWLPFSPEQFYGALVFVSRMSGHDVALVVVLTSLLCLLANSLIDLLSTGHSYLILEEAEWVEEDDAPAGGPTQ